MKDRIKLQAHRGVSTECPENTMAAFRTAIIQGYEYIELDPSYTSDNVIVILHDKTLARTARKDGIAPDKSLKMADITYADAREYEYGSWFSPKYKGEELPLLSEALALAKDNGVKVKLDNKINFFPEEAEKALFAVIEEYEDTVALTSGSADILLKYGKRFPLAELHYDGEVTEEILASLSEYSERLTVWLPCRSALTAWVKIPFVSEELCATVKKYAKLGLWIIGDEKSFADISGRFSPYLVETTGAVKPDTGAGMLCDMHTHSQNSHDSVCPVAEMAEAQLNKKATAFAVTDHCDIQYYVERDMPGAMAASAGEAERTAEKYADKIAVLAGLEIGEGLWNAEYVDNILNSRSYDVVLSSVHAVRYKELTAPFSKIDFSAIPKEEVEDYLDKYFDELLEMTETVPCDIMPHLTCPFSYIVGKYGIDIPTARYAKKIEKILYSIIRRGIAMEVNTARIGAAYNEYMPEEWIIEKYKSMGGYLITLGSDAHAAEKASNGFDRAVAMLKKLGFTNCYYYKNRVGIQYKL